MYCLILQKSKFAGEIIKCKPSYKYTIDIHKCLLSPSLT